MTPSFLFIKTVGFFPVPLNALAPTLVSFKVFTVIFLSFLQFLNALLPIFLTLFPITILVIFLLFLNALLSIDETSNLAPARVI